MSAEAIAGHARLISAQRSVDAYSLPIIGGFNIRPDPHHPERYDDRDNFKR
jgi:hypothetical protein